VVARAAVIGVLLLAAIGIMAPSAYSHPLHTTLTELTVASDGSVQIVIRAFVDDFSAALTRRAALSGGPIATPPDSAAARYIGESVILTDGAGRRVALALAKVRRTGDLLWITLRAPALAPVAGARLTNRLLFERWDDQVNIVQSSVGARRQTLLFTKRDGTALKGI
jgi:uncharacterized protein DUF6702